MKIKNKILYLSLIILVTLDQIIKCVVVKSLDLLQSINIIPNFFSITYVENDGAAWSIMAGNRIFLILITFLAIILIYIYFIKNKKITKLESITYGVLYSGIIGNLIDRIFRGRVVDYLDFKIFSYDYPIFNLADICIVVSVILLIIQVFRGEKNANNNN